ncbi:MAG: single-stranded DNA-binding protein [Patescibacteria group bacterium]
MAFYLNRATLLGRIANDHNLRYTSSGRAVLNARIATSYSYQNDEGEWVDVPQFTTCVLWGRSAEIVAEQTGKGDYLYVEGRLQTRDWEDQEGNKRYATEIQVQRFIIPRNKKEGAVETEIGSEGADGVTVNDAPEPSETGSEDEDIDSDSIPF